MINRNLFFSYIILAITVAFCVVTSLINMRYNVDSMFDEAFLYFNQKSVFEGNVNGISFGTNIIASVFGEKLCGTIFNMRLIGWVLKIVCVLIFSILSWGLFGRNWKIYIAYTTISFLMICPCLNDIVICQNGLAQLFLCVNLALCYRILSVQSVWNVFWSTLIGVFSVMGLFSILPATVLIMICILILLFVRYWRKWRLLVLYICSVIVGFCIGVGLFHYFILDMNNAILAIIETASNITTLNRGYDPISFIVNLLLFLRDWILSGIFMFGCFYVADKISHNTKWFSVLLLLGMFCVYAYYQIQPKITTPMLLSCMWLLLLYDRTKDSNDMVLSIDFNLMLDFFLAVSPIILSIGTNTYLGAKMRYFLLPWVILLFRIGWNNRNVQHRLTMSIFVAVLLCQSYASSFRVFDEHMKKIDNGPLANMYLTSKQATHFALCDSIVSEYNFQPQKSVIYANQLGMMAICYLNGINCANYFQPMDFVANAQKDDLPTPDFMLLTDYDVRMADTVLTQMGWGWPEEFDVYNVGTPETINLGYPTDRMLYCRKSLKKND